MGSFLDMDNPPLSIVFRTRGDYDLDFIYFCAINCKGTFGAFGISGGADFPTEQDDSVTEIRAFLGRQNGTELALYFFRVLSLGQAQTAADADTVGVANNASGFCIEVSQKKIRSLAPDTRQPEKLIHGSGNLSVVVGQKHLSTISLALCL